MSGQDYKFEGWVGKDKDCVHGKMQWEEFKPKTWEEVRILPRAWIEKLLTDMF